MEIHTREETWDSFWARLLRIDYFAGKWDMYHKVADARAQWLETTFALDRARPILSCACGEGGIELALARRGFKVTGIDRSTTFIHHAREQAAKDDLNDATFLTGDLSKNLDLPGGFGLVYCFDTFGMLSSEVEQGLVTRMVRALDRGGRLLVDSPQREGLKPSRTWTPLNDGFLLIDNKWDPVTGIQMLVPLFIQPDGTRVVLNDPYDKSHEQISGVPRYIYKPEELERMLRSSGMPAQVVRHNRAGYYMVIADRSLEETS